MLQAKEARRILLEKFCRQFSETLSIYKESKKTKRREKQFIIFSRFRNFANFLSQSSSTRKIIFQAGTELFLT